ncbi:lipopolysaccharide biosynthesis protein [Facklamia hominis]
MNKLREGIIYNSIGKYSNVLISLIVQIILARMITPKEFGIIAIVNVFLVFFQLLSDFGFGPAVIQQKDLDDLEINHIYSFTVYYSIVLALLLCFSSKFITNFYNLSELRTAIPLMSIVLLLNSLISLPQSILLKQKNFKIVNYAQIFGNLFNGLISVFFAYLGYSFMSIIFGQITRGIILLCIYLYLTKMRFTFHFSFKPISKIFGFAKNQLIFNIINYFSRNLDNILIGRYMSPTELGFYDKAYQLTLYPNSIFTGVITSAIQPVFSEFEDNVSHIKNGYLRVTNVLANLSIPLTVFLFFNSKDIILLLYGEQWLNSEMVFKILCISVWIQMLQSCTGAFLQSANRTDLLLLSGILSSILNIIGIIFGIRLGDIKWVAIMILISFSINFIQTNFLMMNIAFNTTIIEFFKNLLKPVVLGLIILCIFIFVPSFSFNPFINLTINGTILLCGMLIGLLVTDQFRDLLSILK